MKILYVHHVRNFDSGVAYESDSFVSANSRLYGAQELDTWGGVRLLKSLSTVDRFEISPNLNSSRFVESGFQEKSLVRWHNFNNRAKRGNAHRLAALIKNRFDPSVSYWQERKLISHFQEVLTSKQYDLVWVDTQFYLPLLSKLTKSPVIIRSVNFEPRHVLAEDDSSFRYLKALPKTLTELRASRIANIVSISPRDAGDYNKIGIQTSLLPLRQLPFVLETEFSPINDSESIYFSGSSYDVLHNRRNLYFIINEIAPKLAQIAPEVRINISGHRFPDGLSTGNNVSQVGFLGDLQSKLLGSLSVIVPYSGGAGMQSKVFESLTIGARVIANPNAIAGYPFKDALHYTPARNSSEFIEAILFTIKHKDELMTQAEAAKRLAQDLFSRPNIMARLQKTVESIL